MDALDFLKNVAIESGNEVRVYNIAGKAHTVTIRRFTDAKDWLAYMQATRECSQTYEKGGRVIVKLAAELITGKEELFGLSEVKPDKDGNVQIAITDESEMKLALRIQFCCYDPEFTLAQAYYLCRVNALLAMSIGQDCDDLNAMVQSAKND